MKSLGTDALISSSTSFEGWSTSGAKFLVPSFSLSKSANTFWLCIAAPCDINDINDIFAVNPNFRLRLRRFDSEGAARDTPTNACPKELPAQRRAKERLRA